MAATGQTAEKVLTWTFTIILSCVSLYANYLYAMFFSPEHQHDIWHIQILWGITTTGWLSPIIASSYPLFAMIFMYLIERVISRKAETPQEMRLRLQTLKEKKEIEQQIKNVTNGQVKNAAITAIDSGLDVFNHFKNRVAKRSQDGIQADEQGAERAITESEQEQSSVDQRGQQGGVLTTEFGTDNHNHEGDHREWTAEKQTDQERDQASSSTTISGRTSALTEDAPVDPQTRQERDQASPKAGVSGRSVVSVEDAAKMLHVEPKTVETLRNRGILKAHPGNQDRITLASIRAYDEKRSRKPKTAFKGSSSPTVDANQPGLMIVPDEQGETGVDALEMTFAALKEKPAITDEELAERLHLKRPASARFWRLKADEIMKASSANPDTTIEPVDESASS